MILLCFVKKQVEDSFKFCGPLIIYELYETPNSKVLDDIPQNWTYDTAAPQPCLNLLSWVAELSSGVGGIVPKVWFTMLLTLLLYYRKLWITRIIALAVCAVYMHTRGCQLDDTWAPALFQSGLNLAYLMFKLVDK